MSVVYMYKRLNANGRAGNSFYKPDRYQRGLKKGKNPVAVRAYAILQSRIHKIKNVSQWADHVGYSRGWLVKNLREEYGKEAKVLIREVRKIRITNAILESPSITSYCVARQVGLNNDKALYKFLNYHYQTSFSKLRTELLNSSLTSNGVRAC